MATTLDLKGKGVMISCPDIVHSYITEIQQPDGIIYSIHAWIPSVAPMTELVDSHSSSDEGIGGFPQ